MLYFRKKDSRLSKRELVMLLLMVIVLVWFVMILMYRYVQVVSYYYRVLPNTYIGNYSVSDVSFGDLESIVSSFEDKVLNEKVMIKCNGKEYIYSYQELGLEINKDKIMDSIAHYQRSLNWWKLNRILMHNIDHAFNYSYIYDNEKLKEFLYHFKSLVENAHGEGMKVMIDIVFNHTSRDSYLVKHHPEWMYKNKEGKMSNKVGDWSDVYDLEYDAPGLVDYLVSVIEHYCALGVDGFRFDVASLLPKKFFLALRKMLDEKYPEMRQIMETYF